MCGRFTLNATGREIARHFDIEVDLDIEPRYNIAPTQNLPVVREVTGENAGAPVDERHCASLRWGLVPFWADDPKIGNRMINARSETVADKNAFRAAFKYRRCLIPATGFFEWKKIGDGPKQPYYIHLAGGDDSAEHAPVFGFAGIWEHWSDEQTGEVIESFAILTTDANDTLADLHDRMPVILPTEHYDFWLDPNNEDRDALKELARTQYSGEEIEFYPVSTRVNKPQNDDQGVLEPIDESEVGGPEQQSML
jgi:putative SOS response-associated peptidase YedK